jgi:hypothetical protein
MMEINSIGNVPASISQASTGDAVAITVLRKSLDIQAQSALQLIQALPQPVASAPPVSVNGVGNNINTFA